MTLVLIGVVIGVVIGVYTERISVWRKKDLALRKQANEDHKNAMLTSSIHRAYAALKASDDLLYGDQKRSG